MRHQRRLIPSTSALIALEAVARTGGFTLAAHERERVLCSATAATKREQGGWG